MVPLKLILGEQPLSLAYQRALTYRSCRIQLTPSDPHIQTIPQLRPMPSHLFIYVGLCQFWYYTHMYSLSVFLQGWCIYSLFFSNIESHQDKFHASACGLRHRQLVGAVTMALGAQPVLERPYTVRCGLACNLGIFSN